MRRAMAHGTGRVRMCCGFRKKMLLCVGLTLAFFFIGLRTFFNSDRHLASEERAAHEQYLKQHIADLQMRLQWMDSYVRGQKSRTSYQDRRQLRVGLPDGRLGPPSSEPNMPAAMVPRHYGYVTTTLPLQVHEMLLNMTGMHAAQGFNYSNLTPLRLPYVYQLMPHLLADDSSVRPQYHLKGTRSFVDVVMGIPTVRRDMESYLTITLTHLIEGITNDADKAAALIVVFIGDTDPVYILSVARAVEKMFPLEVKSGLIEVIAPSPSYYPDMNSLPRTLGDPIKRVKWRTKQNLDQIFLMSYAQTKGTFYLMLEDDIVAKKNYLSEIRRFTSAISVSVPEWIIIEFCRIGGIAKLFKSAQLINFITYVQLFYNNMPIDWLMETYIADRVCSIEKNDDSNFGKLPLYHPHINPDVVHIRNDIVPYNKHTMENAYTGRGFFWGTKSKVGDIIEFTFSEPIKLRRFLIRTGNIEHISDRLIDTTVEVLPEGGNSTNMEEYMIVGIFDEFGLAEGLIDEAIGNVKAVRLSVHKASAFWTLISEIYLSLNDT